MVRKNDELEGKDEVIGIKVNVNLTEEMQWIWPKVTRHGEKQPCSTSGREQIVFCFTQKLMC